MTSPLFPDSTFGKQLLLFIVPYFVEVVFHNRFQILPPYLIIVGGLFRTQFIIIMIREWRRCPHHTGNWSYIIPLPSSLNSLFRKQLLLFIKIEEDKYITLSSSSWKRIVHCSVTVNTSSSYSSYWKRRLFLISRRQELYFIVVLKSKTIPLLLRNCRHDFIVPVFLLHIE